MGSCITEWDVPINNRTWKNTDARCPLNPQTIIGHQIFNFIQPFPKLANEFINVIQKTNGDILVDAPGSDVGRVHAGARGALVELHHLFALLEEPEEGGDAAHVQDVGADTHDVVQDPGQFSEHD